MAEDVVFTFDETPFVRGINNATDAIGDMEDRADQTTRGIIRSVVGVVAQLAILKTAFEGIKSVLGEIPEIGQAFGIAKDIILENFLFPLRQAVLPILQDILDWVRDNRSLFVRWGETVVGIFRVGAQIVGAFANALNIVFEAIQKVLREVFGFPATFEETINLILFKLSAVAIFMGQLLEPVAQFLADIIEDATPLIDSLRRAIGFIGEIATSLAGGFLQGIQGIREPIQEIINAVTDVINAIIGGEENLNSWKDIFEGIGVVLGGTIRIALNAIATVVKFLSALLTPIIEFVRDGIQNLVTPLFGEGGLLRGLVDFFSPPDPEERSRPQRGLSPEERQRIRDLEEEAFGSNPMYDASRASTQNQSAFPPGNPLYSTPSVHNEVRISGMTIQVTEGNAEQAGRNWARGVNEELTDAVARDLMRGGY